LLAAGFQPRLFTKQMKNMPYPELPDRTALSCNLKLIDASPAKP